MTVVRAQHDPELQARIVARHPLFYREAHDLEQDRPAHVRAGSALARFEDRLAVVQDDANFVALVDPSSFDVEAVALPRGAGGLRLFDEFRGNKAHKLDLEACIVTELQARQTLIAFGSGSTGARASAALVFRVDSALVAHVRALPGLYSVLGGADFCAGGLNVEGAVLDSALGVDRLILLQRGNGEPCDGRWPVNASAELVWSEVAHCLTADPDYRPKLANVVHYELGELSGTRLTFTDACVGARGSWLYLAVSEASPDAVRDGPVLGAALGVSDGSQARYTVLVGENGEPVCDKPEGIVRDAEHPDRAFIVLDADDHTRPAQLCSIVLRGPWF